MTESDAYVAFNLTDHVGSVTLAALVREAGSAVAAWEAYPTKTGRDGAPVDWQAERAKASSFGVTILTPADADYPEILRKTNGHPLALYVKGDVKALSRPAVALVGTRRATAYGCDQANRLGYDLAAAGWCVLSGLALGIDAEAHRGALAAKGVTVGIIGSALDRFYPEQNRELAREIVRAGGAVVSEFPFGRDPDQQTFPQRNHVVAALARGVVAVEAPLKSGTLITTGLAADLGRTVMAVPARVDSRMSAGCLKLIRDGAVLVRNAEDVQEALSELLPRTMKSPSADAPGKPSAEAVRPPEGDAPPPSRPEGPPRPELPPVSIEESLILRETPPEGIALEKLIALTGLPAAKVSALAMTLRLKGRLRFLPGNRVAPPRGT